MNLGSPYQGYLYSYPHKTAYRAFEKAPSLASLWEREDTESLYLYVHVPFCEMRCGFCNLFTSARPPDDLVERYLSAVERQARQVRDVVGPRRIVKAAVGGGTPTYLTASQLDQLFRLMGSVGWLGGSCSVEISPKTAGADRLDVLADHGVSRVSMGVQSFVGSEVRGLLRPQTERSVLDAVARVRERAFPVLNLDLIYGIAGQTETSFALSVQAALALEPDEIFLYPLYVRPLTGLSRTPQPGDELRLRLYRLGRSLLLAQGYEQLSMRMFRKHGVSEEDDGYACQTDGMLGLGCGARSYTTGVHYAWDYAVGPREVRGLIDAWCETDFGQVGHGIRLDAEDQRRRFVILSLLSWSAGVDLGAYSQRFGSALFGDLPELRSLVDAGLAHLCQGTLQLTEAGLELSDAIGPWLISERVRERMDTWVAR